MPLATASSDLRDHCQDDVLGRHSRRQRSVDIDRHGLEWTQWQCLGGQHVFHFRGSDSHRERTERSMGRGVAVTADDRHTGLGETQLRAHHMHDALLRVAHRVQSDAELRAVVSQRVHLGARHRIGDRLVDVDRRHVVILGRQGQVRAPHRAASQPQAVEGLRCGDLMDEVQIDVDQVGFGRAAGDDDVIRPHLLRQGSWFCSHGPTLAISLSGTLVSRCGK